MLKRANRVGAGRNAPLGKKEERRRERRIETPFKYVILSEKGWNGNREEGRGG